MDYSVTRPVVILGSHPVCSSETASFLSEIGLRTECRKDATELLSHLVDDPPRLVLLLGAGWPIDGVLDLVRRIRAVSAVPCVLHAGEIDQDDPCARGLEGGLDDCAPSDATLRELLARVRAVLRRTEPFPAENDHFLPMPALAAPRSRTWKFSKEKRDVFTPTGQPCDLTAAEFELLATLLQHRGSPVSREVLSQAVFNRSWQAEDRGIDNLVVRLRRKLAPKAHNAQIVKPVRGIGYLFTGF